MFDYRKIPGCLLCAAALLLAVGAPARGDSVMSINKVPGQVESKARRLMHDLMKQGFEVSRGYFKLWSIEDCQYTIDKMGLCFGNNPAAPYITFAVPPWPGEFVDSKSNLWGPSVPGYIDVYRFDPREAIVILGHLPPPAAYFAEQTYLFTRQGVFSTDSTRYKEIYEKFGAFANVFFSTVPDNPDRIVAFSSLSNPNNNVVIERQSEAAFDRIRHFIITPDRFMEQAVREAFAGISVTDKDIFSEPVPSDMKVGLDEASDNFSTFLRYAQPEDEGAQGTRSDKWRTNLPLVVLRVRDTRLYREVQPYPPVVLETRTAVDEHSLEPDLGNLLFAISERWGQPCTTADCSDRAESFIDLQTAPVFLVGPLCNEYGENCAGDNWDTAYQLLLPKSLDNGEIYAVAGTLGTETGNATYVGLGINQVSNFTGVANISDARLKGTASGYGGEAGNTDKFFLYYFTRDCSDLKYLTDGHCYEIPETMIPPGDHFLLTIRDYIVPDTERGPDSSLVLPSRVLELTRP